MPKRYQLASIATCMGCGKEMPTHHLTMNTIDLGYVIPGAYSGLSWIRGCSSLCCTDQASVGALETNESLCCTNQASVGALETNESLCCTNQASVGALETSAPPVDTKKRSPKSFDSEDLK